MYNQVENGYRRSTMNHYVYKITNILNGKIYIGVRSCDCAIDEDPYMGSGRSLREDMDMIGVYNFKKEIIRICEDRESALELERELVDHDFINRSDTYNLILGGRGGCNWDTINEEKIKDIKQRISDAGKGRKFTEEHKKKLGDARRGKAVPKEVREKISKTLTGTVMPQEIREKISRSHKGVKKSKEHARNIAKAITGRTLSDELKNKIQESHRCRMRKVYVEGVVYDGVNIAYRALGMSKAKLTYRLKSQTETFKEWRYLDA